jgi:ATP-binding cassette subfamily B multidrug efflux pump
LFMSFMATFIVSLVQLNGIYVALFILDTRLALFCLLLPPLFAVPIIQAFRREKVTLEEFEVMNEDRYANQLQQFRVFSLSSRNIVSTNGSLVTAMVIWYFDAAGLIEPEQQVHDRAFAGAGMADQRYGFPFA